jgi:hypothetical protein
VINAKGKKAGVCLPTKRYQQLMEDLPDLAMEAERGDQEPINLNEAAARVAVGGHGTVTGDGVRVAVIEFGFGYRLFAIRSRAVGGCSSPLRALRRAQDGAPRLVFLA